MVAKIHLVVVRPWIVVALGGLVFGAFAGTGARAQSLFDYAQFHVSYGTYQVTSFAVGNIDSDPEVEVVAVSSYDSRLHVLQSNRDGTFAPGASYTVGAGPVSIALGDLNGDGRLDAVTANGGAGTCSVLRGLSDGSFQSASSLATVASPSRAVIADFDGDGRKDVLVISSSSSVTSAALHLGNPDGSLGSMITVPLGGAARGVWAGDLDENGRADFVVWRSGTTYAYVFLSAGGGSFTAGNSYDGGNSVAAMTVGDRNLDGHLDLITSNHLVIGPPLQPEGYSVRLGDGTGSFGTRTYSGYPSGNAGNVADDAVVLPSGALAFPGLLSVVLPVSAGPYFALSGYTQGPIGHGDIDADGDIDIVARSYPGVVALRYDPATARYNPSGLTFPTAYGVTVVSVMDFDGDGLNDLFTSGSGVGLVFFGHGDATFESPVDVGGEGVPRQLTFGDVNGDGLTDVVNWAYDGALHVFLNLGNRSFSGEIVTTVQGIEPAIGDINGDGRADEVTRSNNVGLTWLGRTDGGFDAGPSVNTGYPSVENIAFGFLDGDAVQDLVCTVTNQAGQHSILTMFGNGDGTFGPGPVRGNIGQSSRILVADVTGDHHGDVVLESNGLGYLFPGNGDGSFGPEVAVPGFVPLTLGDFDQDGDLDFASAGPTYTGPAGPTYTEIFRTDPGPTLKSIGLYGMSGQLTVVAGDLDADGIPDLIKGDHNTLRMLINTTPTAALDVPVAGEARDARFRLDEVRPQPSVRRAHVTFALASAGPVHLDVLDVQGRLIRGLVRASLGAGVHQAQWLGQTDAGERVGSGVYFLRLQSGEGSLVRRVVWLR